MTATLTRPRPRTTTPTVENTSTAQPPRSTSTPGRRRINRGRAGLGVMITALSLITVVTLYNRADDRTEVLALARRVPAGQVITRADLTTVEVPAGSALATIGIDRLRTITGQVAVANLEPGTLLAPTQVADQPLIPADSEIIGAMLRSGQYPTGLRVGDSVRVVETPPAASTADASAVPIDHGAARVTDLSEPEAGASGITVSLLVASDAAVVLSSAGAAGRLSLTVVGS